MLANNSTRDVECFVLNLKAAALS